MRDRPSLITRKPKIGSWSTAFLTNTYLNTFLQKEAGPLITCIPIKFFGSLQQGLKKMVFDTLQEMEWRLGFTSKVVLTIHGSVHVV